jgi:mannose-6-phosphate isomerase-like protein (cupin superfamily)
MNANTPITPLLIEQYCLGLLTQEQYKEVAQWAAVQPAVQQNIDRYMTELEQRLCKQSKALPESLKSKTLHLLHNLKVEQEGDLNEKPMLNKYSDYRDWLRLVQPLLPEELDQDIFIHEIHKDDHVSQTLIWTAVDYPDELHTDVHESFIILQGTCRCYIDGDAIELGPGGYLEIPLHKHHDVQVLQSPVLAVVQRLKVA